MIPPRPFIDRFCSNLYTARPCYPCAWACFVRLTAVKNWQAKDGLVTTAQRVLVVQIAITVVLGALAYLFQGLATALALIYGGLVVSIGTGLHAWRLKLATETTDNTPTIKPAILMQGILLKLMVVGGLLAVGLVKLKLAPLALLLGFIAANSGYLFAGGYAKRRRR